MKEIAKIFLNLILILFIQITITIVFNKFIIPKEALEVEKILIYIPISIFTISIYNKLKF